MSCDWIIIIIIIIRESKIAIHMIGQFLKSMLPFISCIIILSSTICPFQLLAIVHYIYNWYDKTE